MTGNASIQYKSHRNGRITDDQGGQIGISGGEATCLKEKGHDQVVCLPSFLDMTRFFFHRELKTQIITYLAHFATTASKMQSPLPCRRLPGTNHVNYQHSAS